MAATILGAVSEEFATEIKALERVLYDGKCTDFSEYRYVCGQIRGLRTALTKANDLQRKMEYDDDD